jgi:hypothetical protein
MREESAKKKARERDEDKKMAKRLDATRENDNRIEQEKIREREREKQKSAKKPYRKKWILDIVIERQVFGKKPKKSNR